MVTSGYSQFIPCENKTCDSLAVRTILDSNGYEYTQVPYMVSNYYDMDRIDFLDFRKYKLTSLPSDIGKLGGLEVLKLAGSSLQSLPPEIGQLTYLRHMGLGGNQLSSLPLEIEQLTVLENLEIGGNNFTIFPPEIAKLTALKKLTIGSNHLIILPAFIGQLAALEVLWLIDNSITSLPSEIGQLTSLKILIASYNQLETIPPEIGQLTNLVELSLSYNQLVSLPLQIEQLTPTDFFDLRFNLLCDLPQSTIDWATSYSFYTNEEQLQMLEIEFCEGFSSLDPILKFPNTISINHNPFTQHITITFPQGNSTNTLHIYNTSGKQIKAFEGITKLVTWNTESQSRGVYFLKAMMGSMQIVRKFVLE